MTKSEADTIVTALGPTVARAMGKDFEDAYATVYHAENARLRSRLAELIAEYPDDLSLCWELQRWGSPRQVLASLVKQCQPGALRAEGITRAPTTWQMDEARSLVEAYKAAVADEQTKAAS